MKKRTVETLETKILDSEAPFAIREAFNLLRTNLMYSIADGAEQAPVFAVTSSSEGTGKSTVITNLAISFTQLGQKVLLIDADMRCPVLHEYFGIEDTNLGLSELISGIAKDVIVKDIIPNLDIITSGRIPPNPSELITSNRFAAFLDTWKKEYDVIFVDFPPIGIVTDSIANSKAITGYIFTVRSGKSTAKKINTSIEAMERIGAKILGVVLNDYDIKGTHHYGHYYNSHTKYYESAQKIAAKAAKETAENE